METDWVGVVIAEARSQAPEVPDISWDQLEKLLRGMFSDKPLSAKPLASVASKLLNDMSSASPDSRTEQ
jgi:hypothetical protein